MAAGWNSSVEGGRVEDARLITGEGRFSDDVREPGQAGACFVRSPHAHARILGVDITAAQQHPGVIAVLVAADMEAAGVGNVSVPAPLVGRGGRKLVVPHRPALAGDRVMHVGQAVAVVVAETFAIAQDAADLVAVDYESLHAVIGAEAALAPGAPQLWPEAPGNVAIDWPGAQPSEEDEAEVERILAEAPRRVRIVAVNQRLAGVPLEPRGATASFDTTTGRYTIRCGSQGAGPLRAQLAGVMRIEPASIRVLTDDVGGGFGLKTAAYPEYAALLVAARLTGRNVHWAATRSEAFTSDNQGRDNVCVGELALDGDGRFQALCVRNITNMGAFLSSHGAHIATTNFGRCFPTVYAIPKVAVAVTCAFTNTVPIGPYRGAGRPEANYLMERLVEAAARQTGIDPVELRRRNLIAPAAIPYDTAVGTSYDSGEFEAILDKALVLSDYAGFGVRRGASARAGKLRGIGVSCFLEHAGGQGTESADLSFDGGGQLSLGLGVQSNGQGHATLYRALLAEQLRIPLDTVVVRQGDSDLGLKGGPSVASRSTMTVSAAMVKAVETIVAKGRHFAAEELEAAEHDIAFRDGAFEIAGTDRKISLFTLATLIADRKARGEIEATLDTRETVDVPQSFPNGCHVAEVEIDPETGLVRVVGYVAVDDCGTVLNHQLVEGQILGGLAQGLGQALMEAVVYDAEGQILTASFNDYAMPRAGEVPPVISEEHPVFCRTNPLGVKGVGEAGTTGSIAAIMNAIADAVPGGRGVDIQMPATPEKVWRACRGDG